VPSVILVPTLQRGNLYITAPAVSYVVLERQCMYSHAGAWERE